ncbi:methylmalonyl-CoA mutase family protein [Maricaulis sp.]|uniref:methylmalonyl-CoA mutase family protein n=1 Tax=Maricaulis sp. TaxID=1486257 RepID=UPI0026202C9C|nr:methylmalonyl-CoA mutase family protein [Maricaulis sp.]
MTETIRELAAGFPPASPENWRALAEKALRGSDFDETLGRTTVDGIARGPVFFDRPEGSHAVDAAPRDLHLPWGMRQTLVEPAPDTANAAALADLVGGVSELELRLDPTGQFGLKANDVDQMDATLKGVDLTLAPIHLDSLGSQGHHAHVFLTLMARRRVDGEQVRGGLGIAPVERAAREGEVLDEQCFPKAVEIAELAHAAFPLLKIFRADASLAFEAGGSEVQELAMMAASAATYMRLALRAGLDADEAAQSIEARLAADTDIHLTIAKLRAARRIFARIAESFGATEEKRRLSLHVVTSHRMLSAKDPWTNLIRNACAGFAAAAGGADAITVRPLTDAIGRPTHFARRVARNLHILLAEESHLGKVTDPAAGSYLHETLSDALARQAWTLFQQIEGKGGLASALSSDWFQSEIAKARRAHLNRYEAGTDQILGVTQYADPDPRTVETADTWPVYQRPVRALAPIRFAARFEEAAQ